MLKYALLLLVFWAVGLFPQRAEKAELKGFYKEITKKQQPSYYPMEFPYVNEGEEVVSHTGFSLVYSEDHEQAKWVAYKLTEERTVSVIKRSDKFVPDPKVLTGSAENGDYRRSGYDKGHLAPAADMGYSTITMKECFYLSNMSPQNPSFNRGIWKKLEEQIREWAVIYKSLLIVTGPVLKEGLKTIGKNKVSVPEYFYKVILDTSMREMKGLGFLIPNKGSKQSVTNYIVSIDSVEWITGLDFFPSLPDTLEEKIEGMIEISKWKLEERTGIKRKKEKK
ncbi:MAG: DNA/RNA non-specific endonuclease [Ignavibacteriales bacterium]|nr:DNA/RNA non-specific endonuclease [Ignavibacteriales bacterium]HOJ18338.1 DNA/RNA non-specific endonuclease [Ignavibacteriaceae bacterium]